jgi:hypothetical protein
MTGNNNQAPREPSAAAPGEPSGALPPEPPPYDNSWLEMESIRGDDAPAAEQEVGEQRDHD